MEHVYEKIVLADNASSTSGSQNGERQNSQPKIAPDEVDIAALAEAKVELYCNDTVSMFFVIFFFISILRFHQLFDLPLFHAISHFCSIKNQKISCFLICFTIISHLPHSKFSCSKKTD